MPCAMPDTPPESTSSLTATRRQRAADGLLTTAMPLNRPGTWSGYGLVGMSERATLLGGNLQAGPRPDRGWKVNAVLPKSGSRP